MQRKSAFILLVICWLSVACQQQPSPPTATTAPPSATPILVETVAPTAEPSPSPTATPAPPQIVTVCMAALPQDVYLYGDPALPATAVRHAIYEAPYTNVGFAYQPHGVEALPTLADETLRLEPIAVAVGDRVVRADGEVGRLQRGDVVINSAGERQTVDDQSVEMWRMVVEHRFRPLVWSDGTAVTADDSVFSYEVAASRLTLSDKSVIERTASYEALDALTVRWTGLPGHRQTLPHTAVWPPLPRHQLAEISPRDLAAHPDAAQIPLSNGPYQIVAWEATRIILEPNPYYDRSVPLDQLILTAVSDPDDVLALITTGSCDVVTQDVVSFETAGLETATAQGIAVHVTPGVIWEHIAFGVDAYSWPARERPDWFQTAAVRRALTQCVDRQEIAASATNGYAEPLDSYVVNEHPLYTADTLRYDPDRANALLDEAGYLDRDGDGWREDVESGQPFSITLKTTEDALRLAVAEAVAADLAACGVPAAVEALPAPTFFEDSREGVIFARNFDLALFAWVLGTSPNCEHYLSDQITGLEFEGFAGWRGANVTGFADEAYDTACRAAQGAFYGTADYRQQHQQALAIYDDQRPSIPLFVRPKIALTAERLQGFQLDGSQPSELWNVFAWAVASP